MNDIFKNAYFGKAYKTEDERKALYWRYEIRDNGEFVHYLILSNESSELMSKEDVIIANKNGIDLNTPYNKSYKNIVSEWKVEINEEELDELAMIKYPCKCSPDEKYCDCCINPDLKEAYKAGCKEMLKRFS